MWVDRDWNEYFIRVKKDFDIVVDIWQLMKELPCKEYLRLQRNQIVEYLELSRSIRGHCLLVSAAIHRMEDDGLILVDRSELPYRYKLNPYACNIGGVKRGRKSYKKMVELWRRCNPESTNKSQCARETGLSRPTVHKWWCEVK